MVYVPLQKKNSSHRPSGMVKQKYEAEGDLGTVASVAKGKQRTLGFGLKPKPLLAKEVLAAFKSIVRIRVLCLLGICDMEMIVYEV